MKSKQELFITRKPHNPFLKDYISYYYFHICTSEVIRKDFIYYPGFKNALTIYQNSKVEYGPRYSKVSPAFNQNTEYIYLYSGMISSYRKATILSPFNKIGVVFNVLGINHFLDVPLSKLSKHPVEKSFNYFDKDFKSILNNIYKKQDFGHKVRLLDRFFEEKYCGFNDEIVKSCVQKIMETEGKITVQSLAVQNDISRRTLLRLFKKHLSCPVKNFIDIVQFRKSLDCFLNDQKINSFSELAHRMDYYDQPQFIHHFKKLTGINPKGFFSEIAHLGNEDTYWTFV